MLPMPKTSRTVFKRAGVRLPFLCISYAISYASQFFSVMTQG